ncbi:MAG: hypothetical protein LBB90_08070, partial [Tannerella sp.]|nr:hypothetical protein [Tannerella sp.]
TRTRAGTRRVPGRVFDAYPDGFYKYTACNMDDKTVWRNFDAVALSYFSGQDRVEDLMRVPFSTPV